MPFKSGGFALLPPVAGSLKDHPQGAQCSCQYALLAPPPKCGLAQGPTAITKARSLTLSLSLCYRTLSGRFWRNKLDRPRGWGNEHDHQHTGSQDLTSYCQRGPVRITKDVLRTQAVAGPAWAKSVDTFCVAPECRLHKSGSFALQLCVKCFCISFIW